MKTRILTTIALSIALTYTASAQVPGIINYQGRVTVAGTNYDGTGQFKFALVNGSGSILYWSNDYPPAGQGKAGLHVDTIPWMHERKRERRFAVAGRDIGARIGA